MRPALYLPIVLSLAILQLSFELIIEFGMTTVRVISSFPQQIFVLIEALVHLSAFGNVVISNNL